MTLPFLQLVCTSPCSCTCNMCKTVIHHITGGLLKSLWYERKAGKKWGDIHRSTTCGNSFL